MSRSLPPPASQPMPFPPGTVLAGKYRVERLLGEGGMGWVVVATHVQLEQRVAIKFMHATQAGESSEAIARFLREARAAARIQSEHVARVTDFGTLDNGAPYLVMEYLDGEDLDSLLRKRGALSTALAVDYAMQACEGLAEAHAAGIVHRDLKPANLFLASRVDGSVRVKLLDFGISKLAAPGGMAQVAMTNTQALMGSPLYMAPEQMRSSKNVDGRADIWSLGVILYEMLGGRPPFDGETLPAVCARIMTESPTPLAMVKRDVPRGLEAVVMRCLEREPNQRFQDVAMLARALSQFGTPEARLAAERIGRVARARAMSSPEIPMEEREAAIPTSAGARGVGQTRATFSKTGPASTGRRGARALSLWVGGGAILVVTAVVIGVVATRGQAKAERRSAATATAPAAATATATVTATAAAAAPVTGTATPIPSEANSAIPSSKAKPLAQAMTPPRQQPQPKPATSAPKPAGTAAFGGRD
jgi:tRNA A-37 threonylcarbamoyl transferase component Bud32